MANSVALLEKEIKREEKQLSDHQITQAKDAEVVRLQKELESI